MRAYALMKIKTICIKPRFPNPPLELVYRDGEEKSSFSPGGTCFAVLLPKSVTIIFPPLDEEIEYWL